TRRTSTSRVRAGPTGCWNGPRCCGCSRPRGRIRATRHIGSRPLPDCMIRARLAQILIRVCARPAQQCRLLRLPAEAPGVIVPTRLAQGDDMIRTAAAALALLLALAASAA